MTLVPDVEAGGTEKESMSERITRKSEDLNDSDRTPPPGAFEGLSATVNR